MPDTETLTIALPRQMAEDLRQIVDAGEFDSRDAAVQEAVREWQERREAEIYPSDELRALIAEGLASGPSRSASIDEVKAEARRRWRSKSA